MDNDKFNQLVNQLRGDMAAELAQVQSTCARAIQGLQADYDERLQALGRYAHSVGSEGPGTKLKSCVLPDGRSGHIISQNDQFMDVVVGDELIRLPVTMEPHIGEPPPAPMYDGKVTDFRSFHPGDPITLNDGTVGEVAVVGGPVIGVKVPGNPDLVPVDLREYNPPDDKGPQVGDEIDLADGQTAEILEIHEGIALVQVDDGSRFNVDLELVAGETGDVPLSDTPEVEDTPTTSVTADTLAPGDECFLKNGRLATIIGVDLGVVTFEYPDRTRGRASVGEFLSSMEDDQDTKEEDAPGLEEEWPSEMLSDNSESFSIEEFQDGPPELGDYQEGDDTKAVAEMLPQGFTVPAGEIVPTPEPPPAPVVQAPQAEGVTDAQMTVVRQAAKRYQGPFQMSELPGFIEQITGAVAPGAQSWVDTVQELVNNNLLEYHEEKDGEQWFQSPDTTIPIEDGVWCREQRKKQNAMTVNTRKMERENIKATRKRGKVSGQSKNQVRHKPR